MCVVQWITAFLGNRTMCVVSNGVVSCSRDVGNSVPQGSVLGSVLFLIYANNITQYTSRGRKAFADYFKLNHYFHRETGYSIVQAVQALHQEMNNVSIVSRSQNLKLN